MHIFIPICPRETIVVHLIRVRDNEGGLYLITLLIYTYQNRKTTVLTMLGCLDTWSHHYQSHFRHHCSYTRRVVNPSPRSLVLQCRSNMADMNILKVIKGRLAFYSHGRLAFYSHYYILRRIKLIYGCSTQFSKYC